ncbi:Acetyltransferase (GNAT) family protein [Microbacterium sp. cf046]|uniref:GNAT family N-acetyltransferase n=1 Tax=Microbacterium sp. cf046 TaxID=1761803 RepID=UPI0008F0AE7F|nr:GNAT family N-acetyltransferase [Microbacterium sp. cf046]SFS18002.1 Acetyltransferase (GNAT) family protein [Microbacterium sp. cf046]
MSTTFARAVTEYWLTRSPDAVKPDEYTVVIDETLREDLLLQLLVVLDGPRIATIAPTVAARLSLTDGDTVSDGVLNGKLQTAGLELNGADHLFYLPLREQATLRSHPDHADTRRLRAADTASFERFCANAPEADLDEAFVELDHWLVYGTFANGQLVAAASMYPWRGTRLADLGVITLPAYRGRGLAKRVVRAIAADALGQGFEPQYRCQLDNLASIALAGSAGFARFGEWDVIADVS